MEESTIKTQLHTKNFNKMEAWGRFSCFQGSTRTVPMLRNVSFFTCIHILSNTILTKVILEILNGRNYLLGYYRNNKKGYSNNTDFCSFISWGFCGIFESKCH